MFFQDVRKKAMHAYIRNKAFYGGKVFVSKLKQADYVNVLQPKADHQWSKFLLAVFRRVGPFIIAKVLPNNIYLVSKIGSNETQVLHRMRLYQFTPHQPIPDIQNTACECKPDPESFYKHDFLHARPWECEYEKPVFDSNYSN